METAANHPSTVGWSDLGRGAKAFRVGHVAWSLVSLASLGYIWACAIARRRSGLLTGAIAFLSLEGVGLAVGHGDCPMAPLQQHLGDPQPLFELVLPPRAAKAAIPVLFAVSVAGFAAVIVRRPLSHASHPHDRPSAVAATA